MNEGKVRFVNAVSTSLKKAGLEGAKLEAATARIALAGDLGMQRALYIVGDRKSGDFSARGPDGAVQRLDDAIAGWVSQQGGEFFGTRVAGAATAAWRDFMVTAEGKEVAKRDSEIERAQNLAHSKIAVDWAFGQGLAASLEPKKYTGPTVAELIAKNGPLPKARPGETLSMEYMRYRDQLEEAAKAESSDAWIRFITDAEDEPGVAHLAAATAAARAAGERASADEGPNASERVAEQRRLGGFNPFG